ncbi:MAG: MFS transporter [Micavibrio sp.]|nr:MAG: MFS transporter [Micavibrio sp.]
MRKIIRDTWPLFFGLSMMMLGNGLQGTLLGVRAGLEGFSVSTIGLIMSCYYIGFLAGSILAPQLVERVGHIRVFSALASIASVSVLLHIVFDEPAAWGALRVLTGFAYAGLFIVIESWLNNAATTKTRGTLLASYMATTYAGLIFGQYLINVSDPAGIELFVITSALVSLSLVPLSLISRRVPDFEAPETVSLRHLIRISPQGVYGVFSSGMQGGVVLGIGAVYAYTIGLDTTQIASFMACFILGGLLLQYPLGALSDRIQRRHVLSFAALMSCLSAFAAYWFEDVLVGDFLLMKIAVFVVGGFSFPIYALSIAHVNDKIPTGMMTRASGKMILVNGAGAVVAPAAATTMMAGLGSAGFFLIIAFIHGAFTLVSVYRGIVGKSIKIEDQSDFTPVPARVSPAIGTMLDEESEG